MVGLGDPQASGGGGDPELLLRSLAGFARAVAEAGEPSRVLGDLAEQVTLLMDATRAGVALHDGGRLVSKAVTPPALADLEMLQERRQEGPCVEAARSGRMVAVGDLSQAGHRWPHVVTQAQAVGIRSVAAIPLRSGDAVLGSVSVYHSAPRRWTGAAARSARVLAELAAGYLMMARQVEEKRVLTAQLQKALDSRIVIEQAKGMIAAQRQVHVDAAFEILRRHANGHGASIEATADAVVRLGLRP